MENNMKKKSLYSRREFFKRSFAKTLPIVSILAITSIPSISYGYITDCTDGSCQGSCSGNCYGNCSGSCKDSCEGCSGTCKGDCAGQCVTQCKY